jgi:hypothetical protein
MNNNMKYNCKHSIKPKLCGASFGYFVRMAFVLPFYLSVEAQMTQIPYLWRCLVLRGGQNDTNTLFVALFSAAWRAK